MTEPHSTAAGAISGAVISIPPAMLMGAQVDALVIGMIAAIFMSIMTEAVNNRAKAAASVMMSSISAGYFSPGASNWLALNYPVLAVTPDHDVLRMASALMIGALAPTLFMVAASIVKRKGETL